MDGWKEKVGTAVFFAGGIDETVCYGYGYMICNNPR